MEELRTKALRVLWAWLKGGGVQLVKDCGGRVGRTYAASGFEGLGGEKERATRSETRDVSSLF